MSIYRVAFALVCVAALWFLSEVDTRPPLPLMVEFPRSTRARSVAREPAHARTRHPRCTSLPQSCTLTRVAGDPSRSLYGSWALCQNVLDELAACTFPLTVVSAGIGTDASFDAYFSRRFGARVLSLDPTISAEDFSRSLTKLPAPGDSRFASTPVFLMVGIGAKSQTASFFKSKNSKIQSQTSLEAVEDERGSYTVSDVRGQLLTIWDTLALLGVERADIVKLDVEGSEFDIVDSWCAGPKPNPPSYMLLVETHERLVPNGAARLQGLVKCLESLGYSSAPTHSDEKVFWLRNW